MSVVHQPRPSRERCRASVVVCVATIALLPASISVARSDAGVATPAPRPASATRDDPLDELEDKLGSRAASERREAVLAIGELGRSESPPSQAAARLLVRALGDDSPEVRSAARQELARGQDPDVAIPAFVDLLEDVRRGLAKLGRLRGTPSPDQIEERREVVALGGDVVSALGRLADDRSVAALATFYKKLPAQGFGELRVNTAEALARLEAREGVHVVVQSLAAAQAQDVRQRGRHPEAPARRRTVGSRLHQVLRDLAVRRGLDEGAPRLWMDGADAEWRAWFERHRSSFDARLGRLRAEGGAR